MIVQKLIGTENYQASANGLMPLKALFAKAAEPIDAIEQFKMTFSLDNANLTLLPVISDYVEWATGATKGSVELTGTLARPLLNGEINIPSGALKIKHVATPVTDMAIKLVFSGQSATVEECSGHMGKGNYNLTGSVTLDGLTPVNYGADFVANALEVKSDFFTGPINATFSFDEGLLFNKIKLPRVKGQIDLANCTIGIPTIPDSEGELPNIILDVGLNLGEKVHFYTPLLYNMYIEGAAHFGGTTRHPSPSGTLRVKKGTVSFLKNNFKIREGEAYFNQVGSFLPSITFFADTKLTQATVYLSLKGPLDKMEKRLTSSNGLSETEIIRLLALRDAYREGQDLDAGDILAVGLQMSLLAEVEDTVKNLLYLDTFNIGRGSGSAFSEHSSSSGAEENREHDLYNIEVGKYVTDKVQLHYVHGVGEHMHRFGVQYDLNDHMSMTVDREGGDYIFGMEARFRFW